MPAVTGTTYGEQCWAQLFGLRSTIVFKALFVLCTWLGAIFQAQAVLDFGDLMVLGMAFPNITGIDRRRRGSRRRLFAHPGTIYSAGQRQRVVLARALYRKRRVRPWAPATSGASSGARLRLAGARSAP